MYARMPTIFAKGNPENDGEVRPVEELGAGDKSSIKGIEQLVEEGGSAAY